MASTLSNGRTQPATTPCDTCPFHSIPALRAFTPEELGFVKKFKRNEKTIEAGATLFLESAGHAFTYTILEGWAFRYKTLEDGRRQILNFALPSDFLGLQNAIFGSMKHSVEALTPMRLCVFDRNDVWDIYKTHPSLAFDITWIASREETMLADNLLNVGRRTGLERVAYVLLHIYHRASQLGLTKDNAADFPITQQQIADSLGLSLVHTNKTIQKLTKRGLISWRFGRFQMLDHDGMREIAMYHFDEAARRPFI